jgi:hypothetical protein
MKTRQFHIDAMWNFEIEACGTLHHFASRASEPMPRLQNYAPKKVVPEPGNTMTSDTAFAYFSFSRKTPEIEIMKAFRHRRLLEAGDASQAIAVWSSGRTGTRRSGPMGEP